MTPPTGPPREPLVLPLLALTFMTGLVDAASVLGLGRVFTANMTGNIVFLGFALGGAADVSIAASVAAIAGFLAGAGVGGRLASGGPRGPLAALSLELVPLLAAVALAVALDLREPAPRTAALVLLAAPMGLQTAAVRRLAVPDLLTTVLTLTLTGIAADSSLAGGTNTRLARRLGAVAAMLSGGAVGAILTRRGLAWPIGAAAVVQALTLAALWQSELRRR